jgi:hypothetical protein
LLARVVGDDVRTRRAPIGTFAGKPTTTVKNAQDLVSSSTNALPYLVLDRMSAHMKASYGIRQLKRTVVLPIRTRARLAETAERPNLIVSVGGARAFARAKPD